MPASMNTPAADGMWDLAQVCAHTGLKPNTYRSYIQKGFAPGPADRRGRTPVWDPHTIRRYAAARRLQDPPPPQPAPGQWTALQCAAHHGVDPDTWLAAVAHHDAPQPCATLPDATPVWNARTVQAATVE
jgi:hypothetical protein